MRGRCLCCGDASDGRALNRPTLVVCLFLRRGRQATSNNKHLRSVAKLQETILNDNTAAVLNRVVAELSYAGRKCKEEKNTPIFTLTDEGICMYLVRRSNIQNHGCDCMRPILYEGDDV